MRYVLLLLLFYSCQFDSGFKDLTPDNDFNATFYFNSPAFTKALENIGKAEPDTVFSIEQPDYLIPPPLYTSVKGWMTTDTFAFETGDFQRVVDVITQTAETHRDSIRTAFVSADAAQISLNGKAAYSVHGEYYLVPHELSNGQRIYFQIIRTKSTGNSFWTTWYYTANGLWMIGEQNNLPPDKDAS